MSPRSLLLLAALATACHSSDTTNQADASTPDLATQIAPADLTSFDAVACTPNTDYHATGYFHIESDCGLPRLVDPKGKRFYSFGVNHVSWDGELAKDGTTNPYAATVQSLFKTEADWAAAESARMIGWGWNTVGAWSSADSLGALMPYTVNLDLVEADWTGDTTPDYFTDTWESDVAMRAAQGITGHDSDPNLLGWFIDNEVRFGPDWRGFQDLFALYLQMSATQTGKQTLVTLLRQRHNDDISDFNKAWTTTFQTFDDLAAATTLPNEVNAPTAAAAADRSAFISAVGMRFFSVTTKAIRALDSNHMILGVRFVATLTPLEIAQSSVPYLDVVSVNSYDYSVDPQSLFDPGTLNLVDLRDTTSQYLQPFFQITGKPILISEFGYRATGAGLPNTTPPFYPTLATQAARADALATYAQRAFASPFIVGFHWYKWNDDPPTGRAIDGEDDNWGLVTNLDVPYPELVARSTLVNQLPTN